MKEFIIVDWVNNHLFKDKVFNSFEDGWDFIQENIEDNNDNTYDDYYVIKKGK